MVIIIKSRQAKPLKRLLVAMEKIHPDYGSWGAINCEDGDIQWKGCEVKIVVKE